MESNRYVVARIRDNCDTILGLFDALKERPGSGFTAQTVVSRQNATRTDFQLTTSERLQLRKIWEVGTETVMMQTVIHLNGDVFTRMNGLIATGDQRSTMVVGIHTQGVQKRWSSGTSCPRSSSDVQDAVCRVQAVAMSDSTTESVRQLFEYGAVHIDTFRPDGWRLALRTTVSLSGDLITKIDQATSIRIPCGVTMSACSTSWGRFFRRYSTRAR